MALEMEFDYAATTAAMDKFSQADIDALRHWTQTLDKTKYIPKDLTDQQLVLFYNACYGDMDKTKLCLEKYYWCKKHGPELFDNRIMNTPELKQAAEALEFSFLPEKSVKGYDIVYHRLHNTEPSKYHLEPGCKLLFMTVDACLHKRGPQSGIIFLFDMRGVKLGHLSRVSLSSLRKFFTFVQEGAPVRMREVHVLNTEPILDKLLLLIRPFLDKKFFDMIKFHHKTDDLEEFYEKSIPRSALPPDYGGTLPDTQTLHRNCMEQLAKLEPYFRAEQEQRYAALPDKTRDKLEKNFKCLDID